MTENGVTRRLCRVSEAIGKKGVPFASVGWKLLGVFESSFQEITVCLGRVFFFKCLYDICVFNINTGFRNIFLTQHPSTIHFNLDTTDNAAELEDFHQDYHVHMSGTHVVGFWDESSEFDFLDIKCKALQLHTISPMFGKIKDIVIKGNTMCILTANAMVSVYEITQASFAETVCLMVSSFDDNITTTETNITIDDDGIVHVFCENHNNITNSDFFSVKKFTVIGERLVVCSAPALSKFSKVSSIHEVYGDYFVSGVSKQTNTREHMWLSPSQSLRSLVSYWINGTDQRTDDLPFVICSVTKGNRLGFSLIDLLSGHKNSIGHRHQC